MPDTPLLSSHSRTRSQQSHSHSHRARSGSRSPARSRSPSFVSALDSYSNYGSDDDNDTNNNNENEYSGVGVPVPRPAHEFQSSAGSPTDLTFSTDTTAFDALSSQGSVLTERGAGPELAELGGQNGLADGNGNVGVTDGHATNVDDNGSVNDGHGASSLSPDDTRDPSDSKLSSTATPQPADGFVLTLLLISGSRVNIRIDTAFLKTHDLTCTPAELTVDGLRACLLADWNSELWGARPSSEANIRLIYFGKVLEPSATMAQCNLVDPAMGPAGSAAALTHHHHQLPRIVHLSVRPDPLYGGDDSHSTDKISKTATRLSRRRGRRPAGHRGSLRHSSTNPDDLESSSSSPSPSSDNHSSQCCCVIA